MKNLKYEKLQLLTDHIKYRLLDNPYYKDDKEWQSVQWYYVYLNCFNNINRSKNLDYISINEFVARYALRQIQNLKQDLHKEIVKSHYEKCKIKLAVSEIVNDSNIVNKALQVRLDNPSDWQTQWKEYEKIISGELVKRGFTDTKNIDFVVYGCIDGKWYLDEKVKTAYYELSFWESRPATGAVETTLNLENCYIEVKYDTTEKKKSKSKKNPDKKKPEWIKFCMPIGE